MTEDLVNDFANMLFKKQGLVKVNKMRSREDDHCNPSIFLATGHNSQLFMSSLKRKVFGIREIRTTHNVNS